MKMIRSLARLLVLTLTVFAAATQANVLLDVSNSLVAADPTQLGRLSRNAIPQDWANTETYPGAINGATSYRYRTYTVPVGATRYVQVMLDNVGGNLFASAYLTSYTPGAGLNVNWVGDAGFSGNSFNGTDPVYFNVLAPANSTLVIVVNDASAVGAGVGSPYRLIVEGYVDVNYTSTAATSTTLASSLNPSTTGGNVTFVAAVTGILPTGTVDFQDNGVSIPGCNARPLVGAGNVRGATCTTNTLSQGTHPIVAVYSGDSANSTSTSNTVNQVVNFLGGVLACLPNPAQELQVVSCVLGVSGNNPTGYVKFLDGANTIPGCGGVPLTGAGNNKTATCPTSSLPVGSRTITTVYTGDKSNPGGPSSNSVTEVITPRPASATAVTSSLNPSAYSLPVTLTATVTGASPTGTVQFKDGANTLAGCSARPLSGGVATCPAASLSPGTHNMTGVYSGDLNNAPSTSPVLPQVVTCTGKGCPPV